MPPKKKGKGSATEERAPLLGRPGNNVKIGVVGLPNVGKSTTFNVLSGQAVPAENHPFCTIDPNTAKVLVPDERFEFLCEHFQPKSKVPAALTVTDIAGLVKGAHEGAGLGNEFLANISATDAIYHVVRAFKSKKVEHVEGDVDPVRDLQIISDELLFKDIAMLRNKIPLLERVVRGNPNNKQAKDEVAMAQVLLEHLESGKDARANAWNAKEIEFINTLQLLTAKPVVYLVNLSKKNWAAGRAPRWVGEIKQWVEQRSPGSPVIPYCANYEKEAHEHEGGVAAYCEEMGGAPSMLGKIIWAGYRALQLINYFTGSAKEVRAWTIREGTTAKKAAGVIHSDIEHGFIAAEIMAFDDFKELGNETAVRSAGKQRTQGRDYIMKDGDMVLFKHN
ncbi:MAG: hypothetical protein MHM6MM_006898 [Cercozoa sp. M6MM]